VVLPTYDKAFDPVGFRGCGRLAGDAAAASDQGFAAKTGWRCGQSAVGITSTPRASRLSKAGPAEVRDNYSK
jgi:hypothetical protein